MRHVRDCPRPLIKIIEVERAVAQAIGPALQQLDVRGDLVEFCFRGFDLRLGRSPGDKAVLTHKTMRPKIKHKQRKQPLRPALRPSFV